MITRNASGTLDHYAFPGGYSLRYLCADGETVCASCANEWEPGEWERQEPVDVYIDWEGAGQHCANCNEFLPSEYGDLDAD